MTTSPQQNDAEKADPNVPSPTLGEFAYDVIRQQYKRIVKQERHVLADTDAEHLHQMRVGTRRLRTALQIFDGVIVIPKAASYQRVSKLGKTLGLLRDLDVQIATLERDYYLQVSRNEQKQLDKALKRLKKQRQTALATTKDVLHDSQYRNLKDAYKQWLDQPTYQLMAQMPLRAALPELISPLVSQLLLHNGWFVPAEQCSDEQGNILHALRKRCKHVRYQMEFFLPFYRQDLKDWVTEIKDLQDKLGIVQDCQVLSELIHQQLLPEVDTPGLDTLIQYRQQLALSDWNLTRQRYLSLAFRQRLYHLILHPLEEQLPISIDQN